MSQPKRPSVNIGNMSMNSAVKRLISDSLNARTSPITRNPACRAVVTARRAKPELALPFLELLHRSFYTQNLDITQSAVLSELAGEIGLEPQAFAEAFDSDDARAETQRDFRISHQLQVRGFPTLIRR